MPARTFGKVSIRKSDARPIVLAPHHARRPSCRHVGDGQGKLSRDQGRMRKDDQGAVRRNVPHQAIHSALPAIEAYLRSKEALLPLLSPTLDHRFSPIG